MKQIIITAFLFTSFFALAFYSCGDSKGKKGIQADNIAFDSYGYQPIPAGYDYMIDTAQLAAAVASGNTAYIRMHGWSLWAGIMQPADSSTWPVWFTWPTTQLATTMPSLNETALAATANNTKGQSLIRTNKALTSSGTIMDTLNLPYYPIPDSVAILYPGVVNVKTNSITPGKHFLFNGDIMIPTESISLPGFNWVRQNALYNPAILNSLDSNYLATGKTHVLSTPPTQIITKHMFWPVSASGFTALPVWNDNYDSTYTQYAGYETWKNLIAIDPTNQYRNQIRPVTYLHGVFEPDSTTPIAPVTNKLAVVHGIDEFYSHKVTQADWDSFSENDKAIINAASFWANNKRFQVGDYLITIAMHINTKEISTWALQSVFWSDLPEIGKYAANKPNLPSAIGPWKHYKMVDAYGITGPNGNLPVGINPYIELVIHPVATNCNNCHSRAGWPEGKTGDSASYQNPGCLNLLGKFSASTTPCLQKILLTDFQWFLPDDAANNISIPTVKKSK
ncbi:MAG: hypothetical protein V4450_00105 [Bacteroidota bacterium]